MSMDPAVTNPDVYKVVFENESVRVLDYLDQPGHRTTPHRHPDSVMHTLSSFRRRRVADGQEREVDMPAGLRGVRARRHLGVGFSLGEPGQAVVMRSASVRSIGVLGGVGRW